jgi:hypothetical protein
VKRALFCPICGARLVVKTDGQLPEVHRLPEHVPLPPVNLCAGYVITVSIDWDKCAKCGEKMSKHPSGVCMRCFS